MTDVEFTVIGNPQPQGNKTPYMVHLKSGKDRIVLVEGRRGKSRAAFQSWRSALKEAGKEWIREHPEHILDGTHAMPASVHLVFYMPRPKSLPKKVLHHIKRPDLDKLVRSVLDGITGTVLKDDSQVFQLSARKLYTNEANPEPCLQVDVKFSENRKA
jgi:Holliday junction resolvase RusA-like endonuclease